MKKRQCDVENISDFTRYYNNSWVGWRENNGNVTPILIGSQPASEYVSIKRLTRQGDIFQNGPWLPVKMDAIKDFVDFGRPPIGMMQNNGTIVFMSYSTPRQPHKGLRTREVGINHFNSKDIAKKVNVPIPRTETRLDWVWYAFNPEYTSIEEGFKLLENGEKVGVPISRILGMYSVPHRIHPYLAYKRWTVGYVVSPTDIRLHNAYEEYKDYIQNKTGVEVTLI
jgi:hypothetical protein